MREISLTQGKVALVDDEDYEFLNQWKWRHDGNGNRKTGYAMRSLPRTLGKQTNISMHRFLLKASNSGPPLSSTISFRMFPMPVPIIQVNLGYILVSENQ